MLFHYSTLEWDIARSILLPFRPNAEIYKCRNIQMPQYVMLTHIRYPFDQIAVSILSLAIVFERVFQADVSRDISQN